MIKFAALTLAFLLAQGAAVAQTKSKTARKPAQKTTLCHVSGNKSKTIKVNGTDVSGHLAHGDTMGACHL